MAITKKSNLRILTNKEKEHKLNEKQDTRFFSKSSSWT